MTNIKLVLCVIGLSVLSFSASASSYLKLGVTKKSTITYLGKAPEKKTTPLKLGSIRTREARLPNGVLSLEDRMRLRAKRALSRQRNVGNASRRRVRQEQYRDQGPNENRDEEGENEEDRNEDRGGDRDSDGGQRGGTSQDNENFSSSGDALVME